VADPHRSSRVDHARSAPCSPVARDCPAHSGKRRRSACRRLALSAHAQGVANRRGGALSVARRAGSRARPGRRTSRARGDSSGNTAFGSERMIRSFCSGVALHECRARWRCAADSAARCRPSGRGVTPRQLRPASPTLRAVGARANARRALRRRGRDLDDADVGAADASEVSECLRSNRRSHARRARGRVVVNGAAGIPKYARSTPSSARSAARCSSARTEHGPRAKALGELASRACALDLRVRRVELVGIAFARVLERVGLNTPPGLKHRRLLQLRPRRRRRTRRSCGGSPRAVEPPRWVSSAWRTSGGPHRTRHDARRAPRCRAPSGDAPLVELRCVTDNGPTVATVVFGRGQPHTAHTRRHIALASADPVVHRRVPLGPTLRPPSSSRS
jgi:hypothetical protein